MRMEGLVFSLTLPTALAVPWLPLFPAASLALWWQRCLLWIKVQRGLQASALARMLEGLVLPAGMVGAAEVGEKEHSGSRQLPQRLCVFLELVFPRGWWSWPLGSSQLGKDNAPSWVLQLARVGVPQFWLMLGWHMGSLCLLCASWLH